MVGSYPIILTIKGSKMLIQRLNLFLLLISILSLTSCVKIFDIMAEGQIDQEIVFHFYKLDGMTPTDDSFNIKGINDVILEEYIDGQEWKRVWQLIGESTDKLDHIIYGHSYYSGLKEVVPASALKRDITYRISVSKPGVNGSGAFYFNQESNIVINRSF